MLFDIDEGNGISPDTKLNKEIQQAISGMDAWFDTMRCPGGYGGPVVHWWQDSLAYTGPALDWRYEGIIGGYLNLFHASGSRDWLEKALRAGDDLVTGQLAGGSYRNSSFEMNPQSGGTPHEAACDLALLRLALVLKENQDPAWQRYAQTAELNLREFVLGVLWEDRKRKFRNTAYDDTFVPNKAATTVEALLAWSRLSGESDMIDRYVLPSLEAIAACQVRASAHPLHGGIYQGVNDRKANERFFPYYIARCIPALIQGYELNGQLRYLDAARAAMAFILRWRLPDGSFPQVIYGNGRFNRYPQWIAAAGDILRAMTLLNQQGDKLDIKPTLSWLLQGRQASGSLRTAFGFSSLVSQRPPSTLPDIRDLLGVCGWNDKAFHFLTTHVSSGVVPEIGAPFRKLAMPCRCQGKPAILREDGDHIEIRRGQELLYSWQKGTSWAELYLN